MPVSCKDILSLPTLKTAKVVAGELGLNRVISWVHVVEQPNVGDWLDSGELVFLTGIGLKNYEDDLLKILTDINAKNAAGLFIGIGPYIKEVPLSVKVLADQLIIPVFEIPFEIKIIDIIQPICKELFDSMTKEKSMNDFAKDLLLGDFSEDMQEKAEFYGFEQDKHYCALAIHYGFSIETSDETKLLHARLEVENVTKNTCGLAHRVLFYLTNQNTYIVVIPVLMDKQVEISELGRTLLENLSHRHLGLNANIGIGGVYSDLKDFKRSVWEASKAIKILKLGKQHEAVQEYKSLGIFRLFFKVEEEFELRSLYEENLGELVEHDKKYSMDLVKTLEVYLSHGGNLGDTALDLQIHRNTIKYRIARIEEILECNLDDSEVCFNLSLAYRIKKYLN
jgi:sugar diacid utilization regulator